MNHAPTPDPSPSYRRERGGFNLSVPHGGAVLLIAIINN
ncbi:MAG: hypothetical protein Greene041619_922 [Candidatus Peregrinibacteria bacterium Greene0416_19]|nr:MAG: hypothetical protein Greene041619_922 [Candidatus Peregrinibacteria bacterium Greene0416_19]